MDGKRKEPTPVVAQPESLPIVFERLANNIKRMDQIMSGTTAEVRNEKDAVVPSSPPPCDLSSPDVSPVPKKKARKAVSRKSAAKTTGTNSQAKKSGRKSNSVADSNRSASQTSKPSGVGKKGVGPASTRTTRRSIFRIPE